jgi:hypothetical protein
MPAETPASTATKNPRAFDPVITAWHARHRVSPLDPAEIMPDEVQKRLAQFAEATKARPDGQRVTLREVGKSHEQRPLTLATIGSGPKTVFLWSQMHGDESTHTAVLLDLLASLTAGGEENSIARELLEACTLHLLPMLNPDGAQRQIRFNAQGIDINRDARRLVTPEGRTLRGVVEELKPQFGFNLHNQNARTTVAHSHRVASVAVLAPPVDEVESTPPHVVTAMRLALFLYNTSERWLPGHAARYDADYMPTAFGEWVQTQGAATVLLEGGGWPDENPEPMVSLHFLLVVEALLAISRGTLERLDPAPYQQLPRCGGELCDWLLQGARVAFPTEPAPRPADLAVNFARGRRLSNRPLDRGSLVDIGDLAGRAAKKVVRGEDRLVLPLGVRYMPTITPTSLPTTEEAEKLLHAGWGALIGRAELNNAQHLTALAQMGPPPFAPRIGFVVDLGRTRTPFTADQWERWNAYRQWGVLGAVADSPPNLPTDWYGMSDLPLIAAEELEMPDSSTWREFVEQSLAVAKKLRLAGYEGIVRDRAANWLIVQDDPDFTWDKPHDSSGFAGAVVDGCLFVPGESAELPPAHWLTPRG